MYEHLSRRVEKIIKLANRIAHEHEQEYVGTEHVLLAIMEEGTGNGVTILAQHGINEAKVKVEVENLIQKSMEDTWVFGRLPGTPHFRNVVARAIEEARKLESKEVCAEHLLLGLLREKGSVAFKALTNLGIKIQDVRTAVAKLQA
ncbi:MAG: ATP-dependent Clp protease ATP-binding subunit [Phycisphaerae bacterium]|nr:ATP-dependent Clp protease ATP-binding subunit [Phycisphaerae bacterium]